MSTGVSHEQFSASVALPEITVNGVAIEENVLANELQYHHCPDFETVVQQAGQSLVIRQLLIDQLSQAGIEYHSENEEEAIQALLDDAVVYDDPDETDCRLYFKNNPQRFMTMPYMEVEHILFAAPKDDVGARSVAQRQAKEVLARLLDDPAMFAVLAHEYSACPSKTDGGSLGSIGKGQTVPEFERQLMYLSVGLSENLIETRYGFHVVNISHKKDGKPLEYAAVADKIRNYLSHHASRLALQAYILKLVSDATIEGITIQFVDENMMAIA